MKKLRLISFLSFIFFLALARPVFGEVIISEIMYDLPGSDSSREWVEIKNTGPDPISVDFKKWKLIESDNNHNISFFRGNQILPPQSFAIIVNDPNKFLQDWPNYKGTIFRSSFSLNNTSGKVGLKLGTTTSTSLVSYDSSMGANGDGNSIQLIDSSWKASIPTPGNLNVFVPVVKTAPVVKEELKTVTNFQDIPEKVSKIETKVVEDKDEPILDHNQKDNTVVSFEKGVGLGYWLLALGCIIIVGVMVILLPNKKGLADSQKKSLADEYTIIE